MKFKIYKLPLSSPQYTLEGGHMHNVQFVEIEVDERVLLELIIDFDANTNLLLEHLYINEINRLHDKYAYDRLSKELEYFKSFAL